MCVCVLCDMFHILQTILSCGMVVLIRGHGGLYFLMKIMLTRSHLAIPSCSLVVLVRNNQAQKYL